MNNTKKNQTGGDRMEDIVIDADNVIRCPSCNSTGISKTIDERHFECKCGFRVINFGDKEVKDD